MMQVLNTIEKILTPFDIGITPINDPLFSNKNIQVDMLRLDTIHPYISGNKWFKLKYNILKAIDQQASHIISFGGPYSNHLHALAYAGKLLNIKTIGIVRGEEHGNETLNDCKQWGMKLQFISRNEYRNKNENAYIKQLGEIYHNAYIIPEGGNNAEGLKGACEILQGLALEKYTHICCSVGSGTTIGGIIESSLDRQQILAFSALKNNAEIEEMIIENISKRNWRMMNEYQFGGFAKKNNLLLSFMQEFKNQHHIDLDFIYTGKMMFGVYEMIKKNEISDGSVILCVHTGGLQGNRSLG